MGGGEDLRSYVIAAKIFGVIQRNAGGIEHIFILFWVVPFNLYSNQILSFNMLNLFKNE